MTKKHFKMLAARFWGTRPDPIEPGAMMQWQLDVEVVSDVCAAANPRFDREQFYKACGKPAS